VRAAYLVLKNRIRLVSRMATKKRLTNLFAGRMTVAKDDRPTGSATFSSVHNAVSLRSSSVH